MNHHLTILAGGQRLDANAYLLTLCDTYNFLLDAGGVPEKESFLSSLDACHGVFVSHAHADHMALLPSFFERWPLLSCHASASTIDLLAFALAGAVSEDRARAICDLLQPLSDQRTLRVWSEALENGSTCALDITPFPCGHILGASSLLLDISIETKFHRVYYSGDFCLHDQPIVPGATLPDPYEMPAIDTLIMEGVLASTREVDGLDYDEQANTLVALLLAHTKRPRLIAASSLGEAQEVAAMLESEGLSYVVHASSKEVFDIYEDRTGFCFEHASFLELGACRQALDAGQIVIAPNTHLNQNSPSQLLVHRLLGREDALIVLLNSLRHDSLAGKLARTERGGVVSSRQNTRLRARVERVLLPNHAPCHALLEFVHRVSPQRVVLVHGRKKSLRFLSKRLRRAGFEGDILIPEDGEQIELPLV